MKTFLYFCSLIVGLSLQGLPAHCHASSWSEEPEALIPAAPLVDAGVGAFSVTYTNSGRFAAVPNQDDGTVSVYKVRSKTGAFELIQTVGAGNVPQFAVFTPDDRFAYLTNFGNFGPGGSIGVYSVDSQTGNWTLIQTIDGPAVSSPYPIAMSPCGKILAVGNFSTGNPGAGFISMYHISKHSGILEPIVNVPYPSPEIMAFSPDGRFLAVTNSASGTVGVFKVSPDGDIQEIADSPFPVGANTEGVAYSHDGKFAAIANVNDSTVTFYQVNRETGEFFNEQTFATAGSEPAELAFSNDDALLVVGDFANPGIVSVFCVNNGGLTLIQSITGLLGPFTPGFNPRNHHFVAVSIFGDGTNPGAVQVFRVNEDACD